MDQRRWISFFDNVPSTEYQYQRRPLPPLPAPAYEEDPPDLQQHRISIKQDVLPEVKKQRHRSQSSKSSDKQKNKNKLELTETSVVLTLSIRNENQAKRMRNMQNGFKDNSVPQDKKRISTSSNEESKNSNNELINRQSKRRRRRRRRNVCILPMLVLTAVILAGLITAVTVIFISPPEQSKSSEDKPEFSMVMGHVEMRILNKDYNKHMKNKSSESYTSFTVPLCQTVNNLFLLSNYSDIYYGCTVTQLSSGSIISYKDLVFQDINEKMGSFVIKSFLQTTSPEFQYNGIAAIEIGEYIVDKDSIQVETEKYTTYTLPRKPSIRETVTTATAPRTTTGIKQASTSTPGYTSKTTSKAPTRDTSTSSGSRVTTTTSPRPVTMTTHIVTTFQTNTKAYSTIPSTPITTESASTTVSTVSSTASTTSTKPTITPYIKMTNKEALTNQKDVAMTCTMGNFEHWKYITFSYKSGMNSEITLLNVSAIGGADFPNPAFARRFIVDIKLGSRSALVSLNFTEVFCQDEGLYVCTAYSREQQITGNGALRVKELPTTPVLQMPVELVEDREIVHPIVCTANIGYPPGRLMWKIRPKGYNKFLPFEDAKVEFSGKCNNIVSSTIIYTPTLEGNGTVLKCEVVNNHVTTKEELFTTAVVKIVKGDICKGKTNNTRLKHPYECDKYIQCFQNTFTVHQCPMELCYNEETRSCGQTGLTMTNVVAYMNERLTSVTCRLLHMGSWQFIKMWKVLKTDDRIELLTIFNNTKFILTNSTMKGRIFADVQSTKNEVDVKLWLYNLECGDEGIYECTADVPFDIPVAQGNVMLKVKPQIPDIYVPAEIIDGRSLRELFTCIGDVGYPHGTLRWEVLYQNETEFKPLPFNETVSKKEGNCSLEVTREFRFTPTAAENGMVIRCVVENPISLPEGQTLYNSVPIHVIPANYCTPNNSDPLPHPYDCTHYIQCTEGYLYVQKCSRGLCFNPDTHQCDLPEPIETDVVDPNYPCKPNRNGVYFPHPFLCNKYIWCVQGREIIQNCPLGTLYLSEGQCTFDTFNSHCFRTDAKNATKT